MRTAIFGIAVFLASGTASAAPTPAQLCDSAIELASAKFSQCRLTAESKYSKTGDAGKRTAALGKCSQRLSESFSKATLRYGALNCTGSTSSSYDAYLTQCTDDVAAAAVAGGTLPSCGNATIDVVGEQCDGIDLGGETCASLGFPGGGALGCTTGCALDTSACEPSLCGNGTRDGAEQCDGADLGGTSCSSLGFTSGGTLGCTAGCGFDTLGCASQRFPATGQETCLDNFTGTPIECSGTGHDGDTRAGGALSYVDNGDGTISDLNTGLMWEKKSADGSIHDYTRRFGNDGWRTVVRPTGEVLTYLNQRCDQATVSPTTMTPCDSDSDCLGVGSQRCGFAGYRDWRIPNVKEIQSIVDYGRVSPALNPIFFSPCTPGCTVVECSCNWSIVGTETYYWTSTRNFARPEDAHNAAWLLVSDTGDISNFYGSGTWFARAVRGR